MEEIKYLIDFNDQFRIIYHSYRYFNKYLLCNRSIVYTFAALFKKALYNHIK